MRFIADGGGAIGCGVGGVGFAKRLAQVVRHGLHVARRHPQVWVFARCVVAVLVFEFLDIAAEAHDARGRHRAAEPFRERLLKAEAAHAQEQTAVAQFQHASRCKFVGLGTHAIGHQRAYAILLAGYGSGHARERRDAHGDGTPGAVLGGTFAACEAEGQQEAAYGEEGYY